MQILCRRRCRRVVDLKLSIVYRPPYSSNHPITISTFLEEFAVYLESIILSSEPLCLTDDFNVDVEDPNDSSAHCFCELLESMSLTQHVKCISTCSGPHIGSGYYPKF